mmetsp:Transcript_2251/g.4259  ORF Transcript_2251/g.4259 Transcript_2251/m.4259 type:complete len:269 (+) Transcript_2251:198-1004(+)
MQFQSKILNPQLLTRRSINTQPTLHQHPSILNRRPNNSRLFIIIVFFTVPPSAISILSIQHPKKLKPRSLDPKPLFPRMSLQRLGVNPSQLTETLKIFTKLDVIETNVQIVVEFFEESLVKKMDMLNNMTVTRSGSFVRSSPLPRVAIVITSIVILALLTTLLLPPSPHLPQNLLLPQLPQPLQQNLLLDILQIIRFRHAILAAAAAGSIPPTTALEKVFGFATAGDDGPDFVGGEDMTGREVFEGGDHFFEDGLDLFCHFGWVCFCC